MTEGESNEITIAIGYDNVSNIDGLVQKDKTNNYQTTKIMKNYWREKTHTKLQL